MQLLQPLSRPLIARLVSFALAASTVLHAQSPDARVPDTAFDFGRVVKGATVEHAFVLRNEGTAPLRIVGMQVTPPLKLARMPAQIAPGGEVTLQVRLDTASVDGRFEGGVDVRFNDPAHPGVVLSIIGIVVPSVEVAPMAAFYVAGSREAGGRGTLEIINHESEPIWITGIEHASTRFTVKSETVEAGHRYRLTLDLDIKGPAGKASEPVIVHTSSATHPSIRLIANTNLRERVYTFPDAVDLGALSLSQIRASHGTLGQTLMVYQQGGTQFEATFSAGSLPVSITAERGPRGDRWQATILLRPEQLTPGPLSGSIVVRTNDPAFPTVTVPVSGEIRS